MLLQYSHFTFDTMPSIAIQRLRDGRLEELKALKNQVDALKKRMIEVRHACKKREKQYIEWCKSEEVETLLKIK